MKPPNYQLECPFPNDNPEFARGVEWEIFRHRVKREWQEFSEYVTEDNSDNVVALCQCYGRTAISKTTDWPGWKLVHVGPDKTPRMKNAVAPT